MTLPRIVQAGHPVLRAAAKPLAPADLATREVKALIRTMIEVMRAAPGVGLAAPQIGVGLQLIVFEDREDLMARLSPEQRQARGRVPLPLGVLANPELVVRGPRTATFFEGCLSVGGYMALVERALEVEVRGLDQNGEPVSIEATGWPARILQHEVDHLGGTLYVDRMLTRTFAANDEVAARWIDRPAGEVEKALGGR